jgi:hypothetical protein
MEFLLDSSILERANDVLSGDNLSVMSDNLQHLTTVLAQKVEDPDILGKIQKAWQAFIKSGQVWALLIGLFVGYIFKSFTSY